MKWRFLTLGGLVAIVLAAAASWISGLLAPAFFAAAAARHPDAAAVSLLGAGLRVDIEGRRIEGIVRNASGLTYSDVTNTLFTVVNRPPAIVEMTLDGETLRTVPIEALGDPEGITHIGGNRFLVSDESDQSLHVVQIHGSEAQVDHDSRLALVLGVDFRRNMGFEGASWDARHDRLYLAQEMLPLRVLTVDGLGAAPADAGGPVVVRTLPIPWLHRLALVDLSSISRHEGSGHLFLLSHQSGMVVEYDPDGRVVGSLALHRGRAGLSRRIRQAEGITFDREGRLFIVSEPNLLYRYAPISGADRAH